MNKKDALYYNYVRRAKWGCFVNGSRRYAEFESSARHIERELLCIWRLNQKWSDAYAFHTILCFKTRQAFQQMDLVNWFMIHPMMYSVNNGDGSFDTVYNPHIQTHVQDVSLSAGIEWKSQGNWNWDISNTIGRNDFHYFGDKTFNSSLGANQASHFDDGGFNFLQNTVNADVSKKFTSVANGFNLAFGGEFRLENYKIYQGEEASRRFYLIINCQEASSPWYIL